jgi:hypothetical protein
MDGPVDGPVDGRAGETYDMLLRQARGAGGG